MSLSFAVVVEARPEYGNMASALDTYILDDTETQLRPLVTVSTEFALSLRSQVFFVGEILILDESGREVGYPQRKPSKWDVVVEDFGEDLVGAIARATEVFEASLRSQAAGDPS